MRNIILSQFFLNLIFGLNLTLHDYDNPSANHILDADIVDDLLIVSGMLGGIEFYDISIPQTLNHLTSFNLPSGGGGGGGSKPNCVKAHGNYAYVTARNGIAILNISNPSNPESLGYISGSSNMILENLDILNNTLAVAAHEDGVLLYDISNQSSPQLLTTLQAENAWTVHLTNNNIYVGDESNLSIYNANDYSMITSIELPNSIKDIKSDSDYLYVAIGTDGVIAMDISGMFPSIIDTYNTSALANRLDMVENKVAVCDWDDVEILQINNNTLEKVGYKNTTRRTMAIATKDNYIYSAEWSSVQVFEFGEVEGADIDLNMYELNYPYVESGDSHTLSLDVTNNGNSIFILNEAYTTNSEFSHSNLGNLNPGETQTIDITYTANSANASGSYRIYSNDPDEPEVLCETNGNIIGANVGDEAPDFNLNIVANGTGSFRLSDYIGQVVVLAFFAPN